MKRSYNTLSRYPTDLSLPNRKCPVLRLSLTGRLRRGTIADMTCQCDRFLDADANLFFKIQKLIQNGCRTIFVSVGVNSRDR
jgi:hypothetical protein